MERRRDDVTPLAGAGKAREAAWLAMAVQVGFVAGALVSAVLNLADRVPLRGLFAACALAGVYPPGMKLVATWCREDRGSA